MFNDMGEGYIFNWLPMYEVEFEVIHPLTQKVEHKWDYVRAKNVSDAKKMITWLYGQHVNFLNVEVDVDV